MLRRIGSVLALIVLVHAPVSALGQPPEELVYVGTPQVKVSGEGELISEKLSPAAAVEYALRIVRREGRYYWASRGGRELQLSVNNGYWLIFSCSGGFIKLANPAFDTVRKRLRATEPSPERFDYMEVMHTQLGLVVYWGSGKGLPIEVGSN